MSKLFIHANITIGKKLFMGFAFIIFLAIILALSNMIALISVNKTFTNLQSEIINKNQLALKLGNEHNNTKQSLLNIIISYDNKTDSKSIFDDFDNSVIEISKAAESLIDVLKTSPNYSESEKNHLINTIYEIMNLINIDYVKIRDSAEHKITSGEFNRDSFLNEIKVFTVAINDISDIVDKKLMVITENINMKAIEIESMTSQDTSKMTLYLLIFASIAIALSIASTITIYRAIQNPINEVAHAAREIANGKLNTPIRMNANNEIGELSNAFGDVLDIFLLLADSINSSYSKLLNGEFEISIDEGIFPGDFKKIASAVNNTIGYMAESVLTSIECVQAYANGDFEAKMKRYIGPQAILSEAFDLLQMNLKSVSIDLNLLIESAVAGELDAKINCDKYEGDWKKISVSLNSFLKAVEAPISEVCSVMEQVSAGRFSASVNGYYKGMFEILKENVNATVKNSSIYIKEISNVLVNMSKQNLDIDLKKEFVGDFVVIEKALKQIINTFNRIISEFSASSEQVTNGAKLITESSTQLSIGAVEQASRLEEASATTELISKQTSLNAQNAEDVRLLSLEAKSRGLDSKSDMDEMLKSMANIGTASSNISTIIKVIDDIAFQINLLSLNAAVEAARSGIHGKGFSVVAEEVRNLASKSKQAASETANLINQTVEIVTNGTNIANNTANSLNMMVEQITDIAALIEGISSASKEQVAAISQIDESISLISGVTQTNAATAEESASMSHELASQAEMLKNVLSQFKYKQEN